MIPALIALSVALAGKPRASGDDPGLVYVLNIAFP